MGDRVRLLLGGGLNHHPDDLLSTGRTQQNSPRIAELVLYLPTTREQVRLLGEATVIGRGDDELLRQQFWTSLSDPV